jgi:hypothetical protein
MINFKSRLLFYISLFIAPLIIILLYVLFSIYTTNVKNTVPQDKQTEVEVGTNIEIYFNHPIDPRKFKARINPNFNYDFSYDSENQKVILSPNHRLTPGTTYQVSLTYPARFSFSFKTKEDNTIVGQSYEYQESTTKISKEDAQALKSDQNIILMHDQLPITKDTFSVRYVIDNNSYVVKLNGDQNKAKTDFTNWLKEQGIDPSRINIVFTDASKPDFNIVTNSFSNQTLNIVEPIRLTFSDPLKIETLNLTIEPNTPVIYSFNNSLTEIILSPVDTWTPNITYTITVRGSTQSRSDNPLSQDYNYTFNTESHGGI